MEKLKNADLGNTFGKRKKQKQLDRITFQTSRELEYFTEKELTMQLGHERSAWRLAVLKELIDNSLDACEVAGVAPEIAVDLDPEGFTVTDNGTGIPAETVAKSTDYMLRVSDKAYYVAPTRGQLGNALKAVYAAPFVDTGERGLVVVEARSMKHSIEVSLDRIAQKPALGYTTADSEITEGTRIRVNWPNSEDDSAGLQEDEETSDSYKSKLILKTEEELLEAYSAFNPHAVFRFHGKTWNINPLADWRKWLPNDPISPHWYNAQTLRDLVAAHISAEREGGRQKTVREFISEFRGLAGTIKQKAVTGDLSGVYLHDLVKDGDLDMEKLRCLLEAMQEHSLAPKASALGFIGEDHLKTWSVAYADVAKPSFGYRKSVGMSADGLPHVWEIGFGVQNNDNAMRRLITGLNWSPTFEEPSREITRLLGEMRVDQDDPVTVIIHCARPRFDFTGKSKSGVEL